MKKIIAMAIAAIVLASCQSKQTVITAGEFSEKASELVDQTIVIKGTAIHVCERSGMKLFLADSLESENVVCVMAQEGQNKFDAETVGKQYTVKGIVRAYVQEETCAQQVDSCAQVADSCAQVADSCAQVADSCAQVADSCARQEIAQEGHECKAGMDCSKTFYYVENISFTIAE